MRLDRLKPHPVLDYLLIQHNLKNDAALCRLLGFDPPYISKIRSKRIVGSAAFALAIHEVFGLSFNELRKLGGPDFVAVEPPKQAVEGA